MKNHKVTETNKAFVQPNNLEKCQQNYPPTRETDNVLVQPNNLNYRNLTTKQLRSLMLHYPHHPDIRYIFYYFKKFRSEELFLLAQDIPKLKTKRGRKFLWKLLAIVIIAIVLFLVRYFLKK